MKVHELIEILQTMPPNDEVTTQGCDCDGDVGSVEWTRGEGVYLRRGTGVITYEPIPFVPPEEFKDILP